MGFSTGFWIASGRRTDERSGSDESAAHAVHVAFQLVLRGRHLCAPAVDFSSPPPSPLHSIFEVLPNGPWPRPTDTSDLATSRSFPPTRPRETSLSRPLCGVTMMLLQAAPHRDAPRMFIAAAAGREAQRQQVRCTVVSGSYRSGVISGSPGYALGGRRRGLQLVRQYQQFTSCSDTSCRILFLFKRKFHFYI